MRRARGYSIYNQAETFANLRHMVRDAVTCHFDCKTKPSMILLY